MSNQVKFKSHEHSYDPTKKSVNVSCESGGSKQLYNKQIMLYAMANGQLL